MKSIEPRKKFSAIRKKMLLTALACAMAPSLTATASITVVNTLAFLPSYISFSDIADYLSIPGVCQKSGAETKEAGLVGRETGSVTVIDTLMVIRDSDIFTASAEFFGADFNPYQQPFVHFLEPARFRQVLSQLLTDGNAYILVEKAAWSYVRPERFYLINYHEAIGIAAYFTGESFDPVVFMDSALQYLVDPGWVRLNQSILSTACRIL